MIKREQQGSSHLSASVAYIRIKYGEGIHAWPVVGVALLFHDHSSPLPLDVELSVHASFVPRRE
jgi:hypothetical protein